MNNPRATMRTYTRPGDDSTHTVYLDVDAAGQVRLNADTLARMLEFAGFTETTTTRKGTTT